MTADERLEIENAAGFTPGPWAVWEGHTQVYAVGPNTENEPGYITRYRRPVCEMLEDTNNLDTDDDFAQMDANARLIAAAPDLLAALGDLLRETAEWHAYSPANLDGPHTCPLCIAIESAHAALVKAKGAD